MHLLKKVIKGIDTLNDWVGKIIAYSVLALMMVVVYEVVSRKFLNSPTIWAFESILIIYGFHLMLVSGYGLLKNSIVSIDLITNKFTVRTQHILNIITYIVFFFPFIIMTLPASVKFFSQSYAIREASWSVWAPPVYPVKLIIPIALVLLFLQGISQFLKSVLFLADNKSKTE